MVRWCERQTLDCLDCGVHPMSAGSSEDLEDLAHDSSSDVGGDDDPDDEDDDRALPSNWSWAEQLLAPKLASGGQLAILPDGTLG